MTATGPESLPPLVSFDSLREVRLGDAEARRLAACATAAYTFAVGSHVTTIRFSDARVRDEFAYRFADLRSTAEASATFYATVDGAAAIDGAWSFWAPGRRALRWDGAPIGAPVASFFADNAVMHDFVMRTRTLSVHAAVLAGRRRLIALAGASTAGKSTTAIACVRRGLRLYSDERCVLEAGLAVPFLRALTLRPGGLALLAGDAAAGRFAANEERTLRPSELAPGRCGGPARALDAVFLMRGFGEARMTELPATAALPEMLPQIVSAESGLDRIARVREATRDVAFYALELGTPDATAEMLAAYADG